MTNSRMVPCTLCTQCTNLSPGQKLAWSEDSRCRIGHSISAEDTCPYASTWLYVHTTATGYNKHFDRGHIASLRGDLRRFDCEFTRLCCDRSASGNSMLSAWRSIQEIMENDWGPAALQSPEPEGGWTAGQVTSPYLSLLAASQGIQRNVSSAKHRIWGQGAQDR